MVVVESDLLPPDPAVVVIPLLPNYPAVRHLNPEILHDGRRLILATRLMRQCAGRVCVARGVSRTKALG